MNEGLFYPIVVFSKRQKTKRPIESILLLNLLMLLFNPLTVYAQTGDPAIEVQVDSTVQINMKIPDAGISIATFSAGSGGSIYQADSQAVAYCNSPRTGIVVVPDRGYRFTGWSHGDYISLRDCNNGIPAVEKSEMTFLSLVGDTIKAKSGIMQYDTLIIYGNVNLQADFALETYPISYFLHGGTNASDNPLTYNVESETISLNPPEKDGDEFVGWTGSNGDRPQTTVTIPQGTTGELQFFANYLHSERENNGIQPSKRLSSDKIWAVKDELFVRTSTSYVILRIRTLSGNLVRIAMIQHPGDAKYQLPNGMYLVSINDGDGKIVFIE